MLTATTAPDGRRPNAPVSASVTIRATPIAARAAMKAPKMRSKVVSAMVRLPRRRSRPLLAVVLPRRREARVLDQRRAVAGRAERAEPRFVDDRRPARRPRPRRRGGIGTGGGAHPRAPLARPTDEGRSTERVARRTISWRAVLRLLERRPMGVAAEDAAASGQRLVARQMNAAMRAGDHLLRRLRRRRGAAAAPAASSRRAAARAGRRRRRERAGYFIRAQAEGGRCRTTSSTKREPT